MANKSVKDLEAVMVAILDLAETIRATCRRRLRPAEAEPFHWIIDRLEREPIEDEIEQMPADEQAYWRQLILNVTEALAPSGRLLSQAAQEAAAEGEISKEEAYALLSEERIQGQRLGELAEIGLLLGDILEKGLTVILSRDRIGFSQVEENLNFEFSGSAGSDLDQRRGEATTLLVLLQKLNDSEAGKRCVDCRRNCPGYLFHPRSASCKRCERKKGLVQQRQKQLTAAMVAISA